MGISPFPEWQLNSILRGKEFESPLEIAEGIRRIPGLESTRREGRALEL
jgi:hypothetical protein